MESSQFDLDESKEMEESRLAEQLHEKGYAARQSGDLEKAVQYYSQALDLCPDFHTVGLLRVTSVYSIEALPMTSWVCWTKP